MTRSGGHQTPLEASRQALRIALVVPAFVPAVEYGGPVTKVRALASGLLELGHRPQVWCADYGPERTRVRRRKGTVDGVPVRYLRRLASYRWSPIVPQAVWPFTRDAVDVGHCFGMWDGLTVFAALGFRRAGIPYVVEPLGMYPPVMRSMAFKRLYQAVLAGSYLNGSAAIIATSEREAAQLRAHTGKNVLTRPNPVLLPTRPSRLGDLRRDLLVPGGAPLIGWLGRISRSKGLDVLVDAMNLLPESHLAIAGPDDRDGAMQMLVEAIRRNDVAERVHLLGPLWGEDKARFLASLDTFVLPSVTENFGNAAVEAASLGVPVVVSDRVGAAKWLSEVGAATVTPLEATALARAMEAATGRGPTTGMRAGAIESVRDAVAATTVATRQVFIYQGIVRSRSASKRSSKRRPAPMGTGANHERR